MKSAFALIAAASLFCIPPFAAGQEPQEPANDLIELYERMRREGLTEQDLPRLVEERSGGNPAPSEIADVERMMREALELELKRAAEERQGPERRSGRSVARDGRGWMIGLLVEPVPPFLREHFRLEKDAGVRVTMVAPDSPAARAGIQVNDIVHAAGGKKVGSLEQLREVVARSGRTGEPLTISWIHQGQRREAEIRPPARSIGKSPERESPPRPEQRMEEMAKQLDAQQQQIAELRRELRQLRSELRKKDGE
jgi:hypothetical protein